MSRAARNRVHARAGAGGGGAEADHSRDQVGLAIRLRCDTRRCALALLALVVGSSGFGGSTAQTLDARLAEIYVGSTIRADRIVLTPSQRKQAFEQAGVDIPTTLVTRYVASRGDAIVGRAYVDTHTVRSNDATLMIALNVAGPVLLVEVTAFAEPDEPRPPATWLQQFQGMTLTDDLTVNRAIQPMAAAPFTTRAVVNAVRRVLAIDAVLESTAPR